MGYDCLADVDLEVDAVDGADDARPTRPSRTGLLRTAPTTAVWGLKVNAPQHYKDEAGVSYFERTRGTSEGGAGIVATRFSSLIKPTDSVLDFGCGPGAMLAALECRRRVGVDINPVALHHAAQHGIEVHSAMEELPDHSVDIVVSNHALEHVPDPLGVLIEMRRVSRGPVALCLPFDDWRTQRVFTPSDQNHHLFTWSPLNIGNLLQEAGFSHIQARVLTHAWTRRMLPLESRVPLQVFDGLCWLQAAILRRRQVFAVAR